MPQTSRWYPASWLALRARIREECPAYLPYRDFETFAAGAGLSKTDARSLALTCNALGHWIFYADDPRLADLVTFKPDWLSKAISFVLDDRQTRDNHGLLPHRRVSTLWNDPARDLEHRYDSALHPIFLLLMQRFDISYEINTGSPNDEPTSLVAQLVSSVRPDDIDTVFWQHGSGNRETTHVCEIVDSDGLPVEPTGLMYRLIVRLHRYSLGRHEYGRSRHWQNGLVIDHGLYGRALLTSDRHRVHVTVRAAHPPYLMGLVTDAIRELVSDFWQGLTVQIQIPCGAACPAGQPGKGLFDLESLSVTMTAGITKSACPRCKKLYDVADLLAVTERALPAEADRLVEMVTQALSPAVAELTTTIQEKSDQVIRAVRIQGQDNLDATIAVGRETIEAISQAEQHLRDFVRALDDEAREGPRLLTVERLERGPLRPEIARVRLRVTLWCEHSRLPVSTLDDNPSSGVYNIDVPKEWLIKTAPVLRAMSLLLRAVLPIGIGVTTLNVPDPEAWQRTLSAQLDGVGKSLEGVSAAADRMADGGPDMRTETIGRQGRIALDTGLWRVIREEVARQDPGFASLERVRHDSGYLWVHRRFLAEYRPGLPRIPGQDA